MKTYIEETKEIMAQLEDEVETTGSIHRNRFDKVGRLMEIIYNQSEMIDAAIAAAERFAEENDYLNARIIEIKNLQNRQLTIKED